MSFLRDRWRGVGQDAFDVDSSVESSHPYFGRVVHSGRGRAGHWFAELTSSRTFERFSVVMPGRAEAPLQPFVNLCRRIVGDERTLLRRCRAAFRAEIEARATDPELADRRHALQLDGIVLPEHANEHGTWRVGYWVEALDLHLVARFEGDRLAGVDVEE